MAILVVIGFEVSLFAAAAAVDELDEGRKLGIRCLILIPALLFALKVPALWRGSGELLYEKLRRYTWVGYTPTAYHPQFNRNPSLASMHQDLSRIKAAGFTGIVTFASAGTLADIPRLTEQIGLAVIMGVWNPKDRSELTNAMRVSGSVMGYSVGHDRLNDDYTLSDLQAAVTFLQRTTGRPVTTTEEAKNYEDPGEPRLASLSDWLFPDVHLSLDSPDDTLNASHIPEYVSELMTAVRKVELLAKRVHRPLMLKMILFPHGCQRGATPKLQQLFFRRTLDQLRDSHSGLRLSATLMVDSAFDVPWKLGGRYHSWDPCTGFLSADGRPRPAVQEVIRQWR